jgi:L-2,4-diaminobutyrate transaminase
VQRNALAEGILVRALPYAEVVSFSPPLCMTRAEADEAIDRFARALERTMPDLHRAAG